MRSKGSREGGISRRDERKGAMRPTELTAEIRRIRMRPLKRHISSSDSEPLDSSKSQNGAQDSCFQGLLTRGLANDPSPENDGERATPFHGSARR